MFSVKGQIFTILGFVGYLVSVVTLNSAIICNTQINVCGNVSIKHYLKILTFEFCIIFTCHKMLFFFHVLILFGLHESRYVYHLACGDHITGECICPNSSSWI